MESLPKSQWHGSLYASGSGNVPNGRERSRSRERAPWTMQRGGMAPAPDAPQYSIEACVGKGSYGFVYKASHLQTGQPVAIKSVRHQEAGREVNVLRMLRGSPNIVSLMGTFAGNEQRPEERTMNIVLEYLGDNLNRIIKHHKHQSRYVEMKFVRLFMYQIFRGLGSLARCGIVHRDLKPANLLVDPHTYKLKICDFGTALTQDASEAPQLYVCSRFYRAPELILSATLYSSAVDLWSAGCVLAEMLIGVPIFAGKDGTDQLLCIVEVLGSPSPAELHALNPMYDAAVCFQPRVEPLSWPRVLGTRTPVEVVELTGQLLRYEPRKRPEPMEAMASVFFDRLNQNHFNWQDPTFLMLTAEEIQGCHPSIKDRLLRRFSLEYGR